MQTRISRDSNAFLVSPRQRARPHRHSPSAKSAFFPRNVSVFFCFIWQLEAKTICRASHCLVSLQFLLLFWRASRWHTSAGASQLAAAAARHCQSPPSLLNMATALESARAFCIAAINAVVGRRSPDDRERGARASVSGGDSGDDGASSCQFGRTRVAATAHSRRRRCRRRCRRATRCDLSDDNVARSNAGCGGRRRRVAAAGWRSAVALSASACARAAQRARALGQWDACALARPLAHTHAHVNACTRTLARKQRRADFFRAPRSRARAHASI